MLFAKKIFFIQLFLFIFHIIEAIYEKELSTIKLYYTTENEDLLISGNLDSVLNVKTTTVLPVLIHGWNADREHMAMQPVKDAYIKSNRSVIAVDWRDIAYLPYNLARPLVKNIGKKICELLKSVFDVMKVDLENVHLIGHSMGAHISGNVGRCFKGQLGQIIGLDSAGPLFGKLSLDALNQKDAKFVQCIHTGAGTLGEGFRRGHVDFYPNGGGTPQPGCRSLDLLTLGSCSHYRAPQYFAESILLPESFPSYACNIYEIFPSSMTCSNKLIQNKNITMFFMGEAVDTSIRGTFYTETNNVFPFGKGIQQKT